MQRDEGHVDPALALDELHGFGGRRGGRRRALHLPLEGGRQLAVPVGELLVSTGVSQQAPGLLGEVRGQRGVAGHQGKRVEQDDLVPVARQVLGDHAARRERDAALAGGPAQQDPDADATAGAAHAGLRRAGIAGLAFAASLRTTDVSFTTPLPVRETGSIPRGRDCR